MWGKLAKRIQDGALKRFGEFALIYFVCLMPVSVSAQVGNDQVPILPHYQWNTTSFFNPSQRIKTANWAMTARYRSLTGALKAINQLEIGGYAELKEFHRISAVGMFSKVGPYISINRFGLSYGVKVPLTPKWEGVLGMSLLLTQYSLASTTAGPGGNAYGFDGAFGGALIHEKWEVAIGTNQVFETTVQPLNFEYALNRYYQAYVSHISNVSPDIKLGGILYYRYLEVDRDDFVVSGQCYLKDVIEIGGNYHYGEGVSPQLGINYEKKALNYRLALSFFLPLGVTTKHVRTPAYEVTLWVYQKSKT